MPQTDYTGLATSTTLTGTLPAASGPGTVITVANGSGWPTGTTGIPFVGTLGRGTSTEEKILFSSRSGNNLTIQQRGYDDTVAVTHQNGETVNHTNDATLLRTASAHIFDATRDDHTQYVLVNGTRGILTTDATHSRLTFGNDTAGKVYLQASGTPTDRGLVLQTAGAGALEMWTGAVTPFRVTSTGGVLSIGADHYFGPYSLGATGQRLHMHFDGVNSFLSAEGSTPNVTMILRSKGTSPVELQSEAGDVLYRATPGDPGLGGTTANLSVHNNAGWNTAVVSLGAVDSGGAGYRALRVPN